MSITLSLKAQRRWPGIGPASDRDASAMGCVLRRRSCSRRSEASAVILRLQVEVRNAVLLMHTFTSARPLTMATARGPWPLLEGVNDTFYTNYGAASSYKSIYAGLKNEMD
eukprot:6209617-Pleurochrysis_carterae.AAC.2